MLSIRSRAKPYALALSKRRQESFIVLEAAKYQRSKRIVGSVVEFRGSRKGLRAAVTGEMNVRFVPPEP